MHTSKIIFSILLSSITTMAFADMEATPANEQSKIETALIASFKQAYPDVKPVKLLIKGLIQGQVPYCPCLINNVVCMPCMPVPAVQVEVISGDLSTGAHINALVPNSTFNLKTGGKYILNMMGFTPYTQRNLYHLTGYERIA